MKKCRKRKNNYVIYIFVIIISICSCNIVDKREELIDNIKKHYNDNKEKYKMIKNYFARPYSYDGFSYNYKNNKITLKYGRNPKEINSIEQLDQRDTAYLILKFMKENKIRAISGNEEWIAINIRSFKSFTNCFSFWYRKNIEFSEDEIQKKEQNIKNTETIDWIYRLDENWYIQGEHCF